jgi:polysaccharide export outer membrane protein
VVSVLLEDFLKPSFYASGEVGKPGRYEILSNITLMQAISEAGGLLNERASKKQIVVFRPQGNGTYEAKVINFKRMLNAKGPAEDYAVLPGDVVYVPQNRISKMQRYLPVPSVGTYVGPGAF